ncbi:MAG TPA: YdcF family protein [Dongiaceae bacterium]|nr:YdcF family protein [Dongiaceae bacterium]
MSRAQASRGSPGAGRPRRLLAGLGAAALILLGSWGGGLVGFVARIPREPARAAVPTDAIVVLTGGSERLKEGLRLLAFRRAGSLFVSGVYQGVDLARLLQGVGPLDDAPLNPDTVACCIELGHGAGNTEGNARETAAWMAARGFRSLRLVTADYHMQRSLLEFRRAMPDVEILPHPVFPGHVKRDGWWHSPGTAALLMSEYGKYLVARLRGLVAGTPPPPPV